MGYSKKKLFEALRAKIIAKRCDFVEETCDLVGINKVTFYRHFPEGSHERNALKELLQINKSEIKNALRSKWFKSDAPALQLALYKLNATEEELRKLQMSAIEVSATHKILSLDPLSLSDDSSDNGPAQIGGPKE